MDEKLNEYKEQVIKTVQITYFDHGFVNRVVNLIDSDYKHYIFAIKGHESALDKIESIKKRGKLIIGMFFISPILVDNQEKIAIVSSYNDGLMDVYVYDIFGRILKHNKELSSMQTEAIKNKEKEIKKRKTNENFKSLPKFPFSLN